MASESNAPRSWSPVDIGAAIAVALAAIGVIWSPKLSNAVAQATGGMENVVVTVDVRGEPSANAPALLATAEKEGKVAIVIRNQPHGSVRIQRIIPLTRRLSILTPDGRVVSAPDPNQKVFGTFDARYLLEGQGRRAGGGGIVFGNQTLKIGAPIELEGSNYRFNGTVTDLQLGAS